MQKLSIEQVKIKGVWWMPRDIEAMKDVACLR